MAEPSRAEPPAGPRRPSCALRPSPQSPPSAPVLREGAGIILLRDPSATHRAEGETELEVLIGQYEVVNALRSERMNPVLMRFPGEWHMPGGAKRQADFGPLQTACRELQEEFMVGGGANLELCATLFCKTAMEVAVKDGLWQGGCALSGTSSTPSADLAGGAGDPNAGLRRLRYDVYVFVADIAENAGLQLNAEQINHALRRRKQQYERLKSRCDVH